MQRENTQVADFAYADVGGSSTSVGDAPVAELIGQSAVKLTGRKSPLTFALTPLVDVIFLLLIFFMLSSQVSPFSMMPINTASEQTVENSPLRSELRSAPADLVFILSNGHIAAGKSSVSIDSIDQILGAVAREDRGNVILLTTYSASLQDLVSVLEAFKSNDFGRITVLDQSG